MPDIELPYRGFSHLYHVNKLCPSEPTEPLTICLLDNDWKRVHGDATTWVCMKSDNRFIDPSILTNKNINVVANWSVTQKLTTIGQDGSMLPTNDLKNRTNGVLIPDGVFDAVIYAFAEDHGYDGVWWELPLNEKTVPYGVIVSSRLHEWNFQSY